MVSADRIRVTLSGGAPWGFRLSGGGGLPLIINKIRKKSQAHVKGLKEGDAVISINGVHVHDKTQDEALELVEAAGDSLTLEIFRGDIEKLSRDKPKKTIQVLSPASNPSGTLRLLTTSDGGASPGAVFMIPSGDRGASGSLDSSGRPVPGAGTAIRVLSVDSTSVRTVSAPVRHTITSTKTTVLDKSPVIPVGGAARHDMHSATSQPTVSAKPFFISQASSPSPDLPSTTPPTNGPQPPGVSSKTRLISATQSYHTQVAPTTIPQSPRSPQPPPLSPKPQFVVSYQPPPVKVKPPGLTSSVTSSNFDGGRTHREVTREQHVQRSDDGSSTTVVQRETTTTTTTGRPNFVKNQASTFSSVQPHPATDTAQSQYQSTTTSLKSSTNLGNKKGPTPFVSSAPSNILQTQFQMPARQDSQSFGGEAPLFKTTRFVPGSGKTDTPGLYPPTSPLVDFNATAAFKDGKENVSPQPPMFHVTNIASERSRAAGPEMWQPNMWLPGQQPPQAQQQEQVATFKDDPSFPATMNKPGYSLVEEQKRKLMALHTPKNEYAADAYSQDGLDTHYDQGHHKHERLHVFAPPVEIHAGHPYSPFEDHYNIDDYDDGQSSQDSYGTRKKNLYADSAFYDTPGKSYPTITDQMKLCKTIAQSLTSAANRRARGAKMFMKRKRKSTKWIHEGHSEMSSSAGDVANLHELDSELNQEEGGNKPLMYFKIPSLKNRVGNEAKQTKMALTQEQFEKLRLSSKKCDHTALPPDPCFDIVADLKAHKGKGGRMFERRKQRSDKFVIDETNAKFMQPRGLIDNNFQQAGDQHLSPREVAMKHGWKGDPNSSRTTSLGPTMPVVRSSLKSDESPCMLKGKNFNRMARGWAGGGEYPVAERLQHISPTRELAPQKQMQLMSQAEQQNYNKVKAWQTSGEPSSLTSSYHGWTQEQQEPSRQDYRQPQTQDDFRRKGVGGQRPADHQGARPKSWQAESYAPARHGGSHDGSFVPVEYKHGSGGYPAVAYKQPIIPGTDL